MKQSWENKRDPVSSTFFLPLFKYSILSLIYALLIEEIKQAKCIVKCVNTLQSLSILSLDQLLYTKAPLKKSILCWKQIQKFIIAKGETVTFFFLSNFILLFEWPLNLFFYFLIYWCTMQVLYMERAVSLLQKKREIHSLLKNMILQCPLHDIILSH